jgi:hypothetical protein
MMDRTAGLGLVVFALAVMGLGLWQVGGPEQARTEARDQQRLEDLRAYADHLTCTAQRALDPQMTCWGPPMASDRFTLVPFELHEDRVCATFETESVRNSLEGHLTPPVTEGCILFRR